MLCVLSVRISAVEAEEARLAECDDYYVEIIEIQERRQKFQEGANMLMKMFELDLVTKKKLDNTLWMWHNIENKLRTQVTSLYDGAYAKGCFDESSGIEAGDAS